MRRPDDDLIAALAEGRLDPSRAAEVEAAARAHPEAVAELAAQRAALRALADLGPSRLRQGERAEIHRAVAAELGLDTVSPGAPARRARRIPWPALAVSAAALAGVLVAAPLVGMLSTRGGDDVGFDRTAMLVTERAGDQADVADDTDPAMSLDFATSDDMDFDGAEPGSPPRTIVTEPPEASDPRDTTPVPSDDDAAWYDQMWRLLDDGADAGSEVRREAIPAGEADACAAEGPNVLAEARGETLPSDLPLFVAAFTAPDGRSLLVFFAIADDGNVGSWAVLDPQGCGVVAVDA
jgi:hypothetical protein